MRSRASSSKVENTGTRPSSSTTSPELGTTWEISHRWHASGAPGSSSSRDGPGYPGGMDSAEDLWVRRGETASQARHGPRVKQDVVPHAALSSAHGRTQATGAPGSTWRCGACSRSRSGALALCLARIVGDGGRVQPKGPAEHNRHS